MRKMRKIFAFFAALCVTVCMSAANYGILVNDKMYYAGTNNPTPGDPAFQEYMVLGVSLAKGDKCQLYDAENKAAWTVKLDEYSTTNITLSGGYYVVGKEACYDFYIKLQYENDQLYVGGDATCTGIKGIDITKEDPQPGYGGSAPAQCPDVILQTFYWDSYDGTKPTSKYGRTKWIDHLNGTNGSSAKEMGQWFDLIWLPQMSKSTGGMGYLPSDYSDLDSDLGTKKNLVKLIDTLHANGARVVADIVINHAVAWSGWCDYSRTYKFGAQGNFNPTGAYICNTDEVNYSSEAGSCKGFATGNADDGYGSEANYPDGRDWDHTNADVRKMFKAYLKWLRTEIKIDGFRYDYCKGYHNSHINEYNSAAEAYFSVMEMWDGNVNELMSHLNDAGYNTTTFDFAMKYTAFNNGIASDNYCALKGAGLPGAGKARYAVTFLDSHDSFQRDGNEFCGEGNSMTVCRDKIMQCYAYLLSMPGVPLVFWPHWVTFKDDLKKMLNARYKTGVHSESSVSDECGNGYYKATITGKNGEIRVLIGPNSGYGTTPSGYTLAVKGTNYGVYYKSDGTRGDKNTERKPITQGIEEVNGQTNVVKGEKFMENGQLYIRCGERVYDGMGRRIQ